MMIIGYKYDTEQNAIDARKQCADYYGLPVNPEDTTIYWVDYQKASLNEPIFWYIVHDDSLDNVLGYPIEFDVVFNGPVL
jgi:hypothetical protein